MSSSGIYDKWSLVRLRKECEKRKIPFQKGFVKKTTFISLLEGDDEQKLGPDYPIGSIIPIFPLHNENGSSDEEKSPADEEKSLVEDEKKILLVGIEKLSGIPSDSLVTGVKNKETLAWDDLVVKRNVRSETFKLIVIFTPNLFLNDKKKVDSKKTINILSTLCEKGELRIIRDGKPSTTDLRIYLTSIGYGSYSKMSVKHDGKSIGFSVLRYDGILSPNREKEPKKVTIIDEIEEEEEEEEVKTRKPGKYKTINIDLNVIKRGERESAMTSVSNGITQEEFRRELDNKEFIGNFYDSVINLLKHKIVFYKKKTIETKKEYFRIKKKVENLRRQGVSDSTIKEMHPMFDFYAGFIVELEELILTVLDKMESTTKEEIKKNLLNALEDPNKGFASIVGRDDIKNRLINQLYAFSKSYKTFTNAFNNICLLGSAGAGKTALAKVIGFVFSKSGILATETVKIVTRADLVGQYVGHTAPRTRSNLLGTLEGVLFIDEAYQLSPEDPTRDFGPEAITEIVNFLDKYIGMSVVIVAGYEDKMIKNFFNANEGLARRFPYRLTLPNYTIPELTDILARFIERSTEMTIDDETGNYFYSVIEKLDEDYSDVGIFANQAGDMLNLGSSLVKAINGSYKIKWKDGDLLHNTPIIKEGLREYLAMKDMTCI